MSVEEIAVGIASGEIVAVEIADAIVERIAVVDVVVIVGVVGVGVVVVAGAHTCQEDIQKREQYWTWLARIVVAVAVESQIAEVEKIVELLALAEQLQILRIPLEA